MVAVEPVNLKERFEESGESPHFLPSFSGSRIRYHATDSEMHVYINIRDILGGGLIIELLKSAQTSKQKILPLQYPFAQTSPIQGFVQSLSSLHSRNKTYCISEQIHQLLYH